MHKSKNQEERKDVKDDVENETINTDNKNKKQDDELKNLEKQTDNLRSELKENNTMKDNDSLMDGKNRLVEADPSKVKEHENEDKIDKVPSDQVKLMTVIANATIATLQTSISSTSLKSAPLSLYTFGSVKRDVAGQFGITPFVVAAEIPQLFKFVPLYNEQQQTNIPDMMITRLTSDDVFKTVQESIKIFNISTMTVRTELNDKLGRIKVLDPNNTDVGAIMLQKIGPPERVNQQASVSFIENRIFSVISAYLSLDDILIAMPKKIVTLDSVRGGPVAEALAIMPMYEGLHPHPYYSVFSNLPDWAREYFNQAYNENPLQIGDIEVSSYAGRKLAQRNKLVIDQYTSRVLDLNFQKMRNRTLTTGVLKQKLMASLFRFDDVEITSLCDIEDFSLLYNYTKQEYELYMFRLLTSRDTQIQVTNFLVEELEKTNRLTVTPLEDIWRGVLAGDVNAASFNQTWLSSINIGNAKTPYEMLVYETFSDFFLFNPTFSAIPDGIEAVTEVLSIYTFMILYPRITQRIIHHLGYRLTQLYNSMYPQIFNSFKMQFGDVRTNFGKTKFNTYGYQVSRTESQLGYVYSIFIQHQKPRMTERNTGTQNQQQLLAKFMDLLTALRNLVLPTNEIIQLDRKRIAGYPYMYTNYTAYASWKPITYSDYENTQQTELGNRLKSLISFADDFKRFYTQQNPDSSQIPRGFNSYYTSWTNQLSRLVSTVGSTYQQTCAMMQETLFNSPFFVGSQYDPTPNNFWYVPKDIGIGPLESASMSSIVIPKKIRVDNFRVNIGLCLAMTIEGEHYRNTITPCDTDHDVQRTDLRQRTGITFFNALNCFEMMNSLVSSAKRFGYAMQLTQWMTTPLDVDNPFNTVVEQITKYMKMATWVPLVRKIFNTYNVDFDEYFAGNTGYTSFIVDGRFLDRTLVLVDPSTSMALRDQPIDSKFNVKFEYMLPIDRQKMEILCKPLLSLDSKIIYIHSDWYFGRMIVEELSPTQEFLSKTNWTDETDYDQHFSLIRVAYKNGQVAQLNYKSSVDGQLKSIKLPYTSENVPILLINLVSLEQLQYTYLRVLAKAIAAGKIILRIKTFKIRVWIEDMPSKTEDYSTPTMTEDEVFDILQMPTGSILEHKFKTTTYATNFSSNVLVIPGYIQWFATPLPADRNLFLSTITNAITRPPQTVLPSSYELGYGPDMDGYKFPDNTDKVSSNIINWNNSIPTVSDKLLNNVHVTFIPKVPQYMG